MTLNMEDYLKEIYRHGGTSERVSNKVLAEALGVSPASVSEMVARMAEDGLVDSEPYKGAMLTHAGVEIAASMVKNHRLWEVFLLQCLDYPWSRVHEDAERLEHATSPYLREQLDAFLGRPAYCPHGSPIPAEDGSVRQLDLKRLSELDVNHSGVLRYVPQDAELLDYLQENGIHLGRRLMVRARASYEGPVTIELDGTSIPISYKAANQLFIET